MEPLDITFPGRSKGARAAVVALEGSSSRDLTLAAAWARRFDRRPFVTAVDGGARTCRAAGLAPDLFVGDLDSERRAPAGIPSRIFPAAKDFSDFAGGLEELSHRGIAIVAVAGLFGGRLDHEWANLLEVGSAAPEFTGFVAPSSRGMTIVTARGVRVRGAGERLASVFALGTSAQVTLRGTKWPLSGRRLRPGSHGLSNVMKDSLSLTVHSGVAVLVLPA